MVDEGWIHIHRSGKRVLVNGLEKDLIIDGVVFEVKSDMKSSWMIRRKPLKEKRSWDE